ncbi:hypothetical protein, partial [Cronobacter dublinensis]|uniref:hypothetical protein n=1 Tax=Cronobacter dublinensis TaxID=413497 RepID=UPI001F3105A7
NINVARRTGIQAVFIHRGGAASTHVRVTADKTIPANEPGSLLFQNIIKSFMPFKCNILLPGPLKNLDNPVKVFTKIFP